MAVGLAYGPQPEVLSRLTAHDNGDDGEKPDHDLIADFAEALARIQAHVPVRLLIPDFAEITRSVALNYIQVGTLLDGQVVETTHPIGLCAPADATLPESQSAVASAELTFTWEGNEYAIGTLYLHGPEVAPSLGRQHDDHQDWLFTPTPGDPWLSALDPDLLPVPVSQRPATWRRPEGA